MQAEVNVALGAQGLQLLQTDPFEMEFRTARVLRERSASDVGMAPSLPQRPTIDRLSFSAWRSGRACPLRSAYDRDPTYESWRRSTPASALGTVRHRLEEEVASGSADRSPLTPEDWVANRWKALIAWATPEMTRQWVPATVAT